MEGIALQDIAMKGTAVGFFCGVGKIFRWKFPYLHLTHVRLFDS